MPRNILHIDCNCFYASVEMQRRPEFILLSKKISPYYTIIFHIIKELLSEVVRASCSQCKLYACHQRNEVTFLLRIKKPAIQNLFRGDLYGSIF